MFVKVILIVAVASACAAMLPVHATMAFVVGGFAATAAVHKLFA